MLEPIEPYHCVCIGCHKEPHQIEEYTDPELLEGLSPLQFVESQEGTYNPYNGHFLCTACYIKAGMPSSPKGWKAP